MSINCRWLISFKEMKARNADEDAIQMVRMYLSWDGCSGRHQECLKFTKMIVVLNNQSNDL
jgi:hypothetical protein